MSTEPNQITSFFHCRRCLQERPDGTSPRDFSSLEVGWTEKGLQIWCKRHDMNVIHIELTAMEGEPDGEEETKSI